MVGPGHAWWPGGRSTDVDEVLRDAILTAVDDTGAVWDVLALHIAGRVDVADEVTLGLALAAAELLVDLADAHRIERGRRTVPGVTGENEMAQVAAGLRAVLDAVTDPEDELTAPAATRNRLQGAVLVLDALASYTDSATGDGSSAR